MQIDWFTFLAQVFNFLILVWLLRRFLYGPIMRAMRNREAGISERLQEAQDLKSEAEKKAQLFDQKTLDLERQQKELLDDARLQAQEQKLRWLAKARKDVDQQRQHWLEAYRREREDIGLALSRQVGEMGIQAARKTLKELAASDLETRMRDGFLVHLQELPKQQREQVQRALLSGENRPLVLSAFGLSEDWSAELEQAIRKCFDYAGPVSFDCAEELICGFELRVAGYRFGWNVKEFLQQTEFEFSERLKFELAEKEGSRR